MTRSVLTLAASVTAAVPEASVTAAAELSTGESGRFDSALVSLSDGTRVVARASRDDAGSAELAAESLALRALTAGARALLPFQAPTYRGEGPLVDGRLLVIGFVPGYGVDAPHLPAGPGAAAALGIALASLHALPISVVHNVGLPVRSPDHARTAARSVLDRAIATRRLPVALASRWGRAIADDLLWSFESVVVLGDANAASFRFEDRGDIPTVTGVIGWHALSAGDPATDLHWLTAAPEAIDDVLAAYADAAARTPDAGMVVRARLYAELEFAKWLVHGAELRDEAIMADAVTLLDALVDGLPDAPALSLGADDASWSTPDLPSREDEGSTAMQTDAYDPEMMSLFVAKAREHEGAGTAEVPVEWTDRQTASLADTVPHDMSDLRELDGDPVDASPGDASAESASAATPKDQPEPEDIEGDAERASRAAFQRWASSASE